MHRFHSVLFVGIVSLLLWQVHPQFANSQERNEKGPAYTSPLKSDLTYLLMGEYVGTITSIDPKSGKETKQPLGLQVRAKGSDSFDALAFYGGLPGHPKHQPEPIRLIGKRFSQPVMIDETKTEKTNKDSSDKSDAEARTDDFVILSGGPWAIFVHQKSCQLMDRQGNQIGKLKRVRRKSPTLYATPPEGAIVLFDGTSTDHFTKAEMTKDGLLTQGADLNPMFQDFNLHVEFRLPYMPEANDQQRGNSGLYLQSRYECQILDSFAQTPKINGCGSLYRFRKPDLNMSFPPLVWQSYDVHFTAPRWAADGSKIHNARVSSWVNGVKVQDNVELPNKTGAGKEEAPNLLPIRIQDHGDPVRFRNIWIVDRGLDSGEFPVVAKKADVQAAMKLEASRKRAAAKKRRAKAKKDSKSDSKTPQPKKTESEKAKPKAKAKKAAAKS